MKIKNRLRMSAGISIALVVILISLVLVTSGRIAEGNQKHMLLMNVHRGIAELDIVTYDYLLYREERMEQQWNLKYNSLAEVLVKAEEEEMKSIRADCIALGGLFSQVTANYEETQKLIQEGASREKIDTAIELEERLVSQLLIKSQSIVTGASTLSEEAQAEETEAQRLARNMTLILMIILAITVTTSSLLIARSISKPLDKLTKGAEIIGKGDLKHKVEVKSKNELGQLATAFNKMTESLKTITASRDELDREVTERKQMEKALRESEERFRTVADFTYDWEYWMDNDGNYLYVSPSCERITGYHVDEFLQAPRLLERISHPDDRTMVTDHIGKSLVSKEILSIDFRIIDRSGEIHWVAHICQPVYGSNGSMLGRRASNRDITDLKQMQERLVRSERLAVLGQFSGSISHELRNPLGVIDSSVYYLKTKLKDADEKVQQHLDRVKSSVGSATAIIESLLNLTRMKDPRLSGLDLIAITSDAISTSKVPTGVNVTRNFPEQEVLVGAEREQLRMAFQNIIKNAIEAMDSKGTLTVTVHTSVDGQAEVSFADSGPGIAPEDLDRVFQPLFTTKAKGIGFGLSIAKTIVDKHGGTIAAKSELGKGATIIVRLPSYVDKAKEV